MAPVPSGREIPKFIFSELLLEDNSSYTWLGVLYKKKIYIYIYIPNDTEVLDECYRKDVLNAICLHYNWMDMPAPNKKKQQRKG